MNTFTQPLKAQAEPRSTVAGVSTAESWSDPLQLIVGTAQGLLVLGPEPQVELAGHAITALTPSPEGWWVVTDHNAIWHHRPDQSWHKVASVDDLRLHCLLSFGDAVLVGASDACLLQLKDGHLQRLTGFESVAGHDDWYTPWGAPPDVRSLTVSPSGTLYVNVHVGGILRSTDQGQTWQPTIDFHADVHEVCIVPDRPDWVLAATAEGLAISEDNGDSWRCDRTNLHAPYARAIAVCEETILMTASTGPRTNKAAIYRRSLHPSGKFEKCEQGLPEWFSSNINTGTVATVGRFAAFGTYEGDVFLSKDKGLTWQHIAAGLDPIRCLTVK